MALAWPSLQNVLISNPLRSIPCFPSTMDHSYSCKVPDETFKNKIAKNDPNKIDDLKIDEKEGDDYLIDLYRERRFLYNKRDKNFKDNEMKENAWLEILKIMKHKNCGVYYTVEYCQKRIRTLREKFSRLQRNEQNYKSGSAASTEKRTYSNVKDVKEELDSLKENIDNKTSPKKHKVIENKTTGEAKESNLLKRKVDEENILGVITNLINSILSDSSQTHHNSSNSRTAETVFAEYIALELERMNESERTIKKRKLMEVLSTPVKKNVKLKFVLILSVCLNIIKSLLIFRSYLKAQIAKEYL